MCKKNISEKEYCEKCANLAVGLNSTCTATTDEDSNLIVDQDSNNDITKIQCLDCGREFNLPDFNNIYKNDRH